MEQKQSSRKLKARLLLAVVMITITLFLVSLASAYTVSNFAVDEAKQLELKSETNYGTITLKDRYYADLLGWFDKDLAKLTLKENTDSCGNDCYAIKDIELFEDGSLVDDIRFYRIYEDGKQELSSIRSYEVRIKTDEKTTIEDVYEWQCVETGKISINGTAEMSCSNVKIGEKEVIEDVWETYKLGEKKVKGNYTLKLVGEKRADWTYDWIITSQGKEITEWSYWNALIDEIDSTPGSFSISQNNVEAGWVFNVSSDVNFNGIIAESGVTANTVFLRLNSTGALLNSTSISEGKALLTYPLTKGVIYRITSGSNGANYNWGQTHATVSFPKVANNTHIFGGITPAGFDEGQIFNIRSINISTIPSTVTLNSPANHFNSTSKTITFNATATVVGGATLKNISLYHNYTGTWVRNKTIAMGGSITTNTSTFPTTFASDKVFNWGIKACDSDNDCGWSENRTVTIDTTAPTINLLYPTGTIPYGYVNQTLQLNFSATDENLDKCGFGYYKSFGKENRTDGYITTYYNNTNYSMIARLYMNRIGTPLYKYTVNIPTTCNNGGKVTLWDDDVNVSCINTGGANVTLAPSVGGYGVLGQFFEITDCSSGVFITPNIILDGTKSIWVYASDDAGNLNISSFSWDYTIFETAQTYSATAYETSIETFYLNLTYNSSATSIIAKLNYDGTNYSSINVGSGDYGSFKATITIPLLSTASNKTFFWYINDIVQERYNQTVNPITVTFCNATYTTRALNFTYYDEDSLLPINGTANNTKIETFFKYWVGDGSIKKEYNFQNLSSTSNTFSFCISPAFVPNINYDLILEYGAIGYLDNEYDVLAGNLSNSTANVSLYLLPTSLGTKFTHTVREGIDSVPNVLVRVSKFFTGLGTYKEIGIRLTDSTGRFIQYLELDKRYNYTIMSDEGVATSIEMNAICAVAPCEITLQIQGTTTQILDEIEAYIAQNVNYTLWVNKTTKMVYLDFEDLLGTAQYWRLYVYKPYFGNETHDIICNLTSFTPSGSLSCNYTGYSGDIFARVYISRSPEVLVSFLNFLNDDIAPALGDSGLLASMIILLVIIFAGARNPSNALIMIPFGMIILKFIGFMPLPWEAIVGISIVCGIIAFKMKT